MVQRVATWEELEGAHLWNDDELKLKINIRLSVSEQR